MNEAPNKVYLQKNTTTDCYEELRMFARHFYELGCRRTAEKFDEIEFNRQRAEEHLATSGKTSEIKPGDEVTINGHKIVYDKDKDAITMAEIPNDLEEAARKHSCYDEDCEGAWYEPIVRNAFIAGAKWDREQMMKEAVEGVVYRYESYQRIATAIVVDINRELFGNKVRVIILPKED